MSTEPEQTDTEAPVDPPPVIIEPDPEPSDPPPAPELPAQPVTFEPFTWYEVTSVCVTQTCPNLNTTTTEPMVYSNAGSVFMICGLCNQTRPVLAATKLDPQPEMS